MATLATSQITMTTAYQDTATTVQDVAAEALTQLRAEFAEALGCSYVDIAAHPVSSAAQLPVVRAQITDAEYPQDGALLTVDVTIQRVTGDSSGNPSRTAATLAVDVTNATAPINTGLARSARSMVSVAPVSDEVLHAALAATARQGLAAAFS